MKVTPLDIKKQQFTKVFRGFDPSEVNAYLDILAMELEEWQKHIKELTQKNIELETHLKDYRSVEKAMQQTFMQAQETSGKAIENARREAQLVLQEAEGKAAQIVDKARNELTSLKEQITILKAKKDSIITRLKMLLNSELDLIKALEVDEELRTTDIQDASQEVSKEKMEIEEIIRNL
ncbi:MAG TPA: DivIVA domain-containing protein [Bacteroidota bacterium]|nr:DivIVA domain-containing protein [Bacteroidota bacterium]